MVLLTILIVLACGLVGHINQLIDSIRSCRVWQLIFGILIVVPFSYFSVSRL